MSDWSTEEQSCREYRAILEECLDRDSPASARENAEIRAENSLEESRRRLITDPRLKTHVSQCALCSKAVDDALLARELVRNSGLAAAVSRSAGFADSFSARVMASVRAEMLERTAAGIWRPLELLASRFALVAAVILLALSVYLVKFAPPFRLAATGLQIESSQTEVDAGLPAPPSQPSSQDEVLISLSERANGF